VSDQDYAVLAALLFTILLIAVIIPAPTRAPWHEAGMQTTLLGAGAAMAILGGVLALAHLPLHSAVCGALAWLVVMPCVWMVRGPAPAEGHGYGEGEDEDDDGGEPWPRWPGTPLAPEGRRPELAPAGLAGVRSAFAPPAARPLTATHMPQHAIASAPPAAPDATSTVPTSATQPPGAPCPVEPTAPTHQRRLKPRPRGQRADHHSIVHKRAAEPHIGRRRRATLRRRFLRRCRMWLWVESPECVTFAEPQHARLRRRPAVDEARSTPLV
jgi:hypothetical protein